MKILVVLSVLFAFGSSVSGASRPILWSSSSVVELNVDQSELVVNVPYPDSLGDRSLCGVEILVTDLVTHQELLKVSKDLLVRDGFSPKRGLVTLKRINAFGHGLAYRVATKGTYMTYVWIKAPKQKTLKKYFAEVLPRSSKVFLHGIRCDDVRIK